ncbi:hypothetical protein GV829_01445 [Sphingomonas lacunae]|uniref:Uncharacterized protein n=1 Tax=Sphingomonas lacunae TaxID=2698828 RepID=A0A6M4AQF8_9SPHN|nr:hypothetical protein [Sphingomonas lacunae]QJQ31268.1 hypothetical protein GV829_01445 [Sphingomonas lacunae]
MQPIQSGGTEGAGEAAPPVPAAIPAGTPIVIRIIDSVSSSTATQGQFFPIELAEPIMLGDRDVVPAGIRGEGQVVHARHRGWGGGAGELILAARYLQWGDRRIALRAFHLGVAGRDGATSSLVATVAVGVVGAFVTGRSANVPAGSLATARLVEPIVPELPVTAPATQILPVVDAPAPATSTGE